MLKNGLQKVALEIVEHHSDQVVGNLQQRDERDEVASQMSDSIEMAAALSGDGRRHCYMMDTCFQILEGNMLAASKLSVGDRVLDHQGHVADIKWCQVHPKEKRLLVDLYTRQSMLTVTGSHRVVVQDGGLSEARELKKGDKVMVAASSGCEQLLKVTKRHANIQVVELEFDGDATVPVYVPTVLTKGTLPPMYNDNGGSSECKQEPMDGDSMHIDTTGMSAREPCPENDFEDVHAMAAAETWPDTDDGYE